MKLYSRITGILLSITILSFLFFFLYIIIEDSDDTKGKMISGFLLIICIAFFYFMFLNRFGFNYKSKIAQYSKFVFILTGSSFFILAIVPTYYLLREVQLQKESELIINRGLNNNMKFRSTLKTKYYNGNILYILNMEKINKKPFDSNTKIFLSLLDKDGFKIDTFEVGRYTYENDKYGNLKAIIINSSHSMNLQNYNRIKHWNLLYKLKTIPQ